MLFAFRVRADSTRGPGTDYLSGDSYFKIHREGQNLDRCRSQFKLVESIEEQEESARRFIEKVLQQPAEAV